MVIEKADGQKNTKLINEITRMKTEKKVIVKKRNSQLVVFLQVFVILFFVLVLQFTSGYKMRLLSNIYILIPLILLGFLDYYFYKKVMKTGEKIKKLNQRLKKKIRALGQVD